MNIILRFATLFVIPLAAAAFGSSTFGGVRRSQALNGWVRDFFKDRSDDGESKLLIQRISEKRVEGANLIEQPENTEKPDWEMKDDGIFGYVPDKEMTGVEPHMSRVCATFSQQLYDMNERDEFQLSTKDHKTEVIMYDNHGDLNTATVPFGVAVCGDTMILGWRGTRTTLDKLNDVAASPQSSVAWRKHAKTIKAQGSFTSIVQNDIVTHETEIIEEAKKRGIKEIVTTGQSLGGGAAQIAHLILRAQIQDENSPWAELKGINVRSVAFCGPMSTVLLDNASPETDLFVGELIENSCNMIYSNDVIPRTYGYLSFVEDYVDDVVESGALTQMLPLPSIVKRIIEMRGRVEDGLGDLVDKAKNDERVEDFVKVYSQYRHIGNVIHYESEDSKPRVLKDMGAFYKNSLGEKDIFRDVKYKHVSKPVDDFMKWHMDIIRGPGLSYPPIELSK